MGCHCSEIAEIKHDLGVINSQIANLSSVIHQSEDITERIRKAADKFENNIDIKARNEVVSALKNITKGQTENLTEATQEFLRYKTNLESKLQSLKSSDRRYHESKKHHHDD